MSLFSKSFIIEKVKNQNKNLVSERWNKFQIFVNKIDEIKTFAEDIYQDGFIRDIFEACLGYTMSTTNSKEFNIVREQKNQSNSQKADGAIIVDDKVVGIIELKSTKTKDLEKRYGREDTTVNQAFNYLTAHDRAYCRYVIVSNFDELRFYIDDKLEYQKYSLFNLSYEEFEELHYLLCFENISQGIALKLKEEQVSKQENISNTIYKQYSQLRVQLFNNLVKNNDTVDKNVLLTKTQKILDRMIFIFFAEDRGIIPTETIDKIIDDHRSVKKHLKTYALYDSYKVYFNAINVGDEDLNISKYNGGLFADDEVLDKLVIDDEVLQEIPSQLTKYDFNSEVDVNILGHIFENSLNDIEELKASIEDEDFDKKKTKRKKDGVFYTPEYITRYIVENTLGKLCREKKEELNITEVIAPKNPKKPTKEEQQTKENLEQYRNWLLDLKIVDPACGSGAFLNQALNFLINEHQLLQKDLVIMGDITAYYEIQKSILEHNLYGVDINEEAVEIAKLSLWLRTVEHDRPLTKLAQKIKVGNSLIDDKSVVDNAFEWEKEFPEVFEQGGFDVVIGNPPYVDSESMTKSYADERKWITKNFQTAKGNWDIFIPFIELGLKILKESNFLSYIIPNKILSAKYGTTIRDFVNEYFCINEIFDLSKNNVFTVDVYPVILFLQKTQQSSTLNITIQNDNDIQTKITTYSLENNWALYLDEHYNIYSKINQKFQALNSCTSYNIYPAASVSEAYEIKEFICDKNILEVGYLKLINTGTIDPYISQWGIDDMQYIKAKYRFPIVDIKKIKQKEWTQKPKISLAGMVIKIEAFLDTMGIYLPLKSTTVITSDTLEELKYLTLLLNSKLLTFLFKIANAANTMAGGYLNVNQDNIGNLPISNISNKELFIEKADLMLELNKKLQDGKQNFIKELELDKVPKKLQNFEELEFDDFVKEYAKAKKTKFETKLVERKFKEEWQELFDHDKQEVLKIQEQIKNTDKEIDTMVYKLYRLTEDEIKIVENN